MGVKALYDARYVTGTQLTDLSGNDRHGSLAPLLSRHTPYLSVIGEGAIISLPDLFNGVTGGYTIGFKWSKWGKNYNSSRNFHAYNTANIGASSIYLSYSTGPSNYVVRDSSAGEASFISGSDIVLGQVIEEVITHASKGDINRYENGALINSGNVYYPENISRERTYIASGQVVYGADTGGGNVLFDSFVFCDHVCNATELAMINACGTPEPYVWEGNCVWKGYPQNWQVTLLNADGTVEDTCTADVAQNGLYKLYSKSNAKKSIVRHCPVTGFDDIIYSEQDPSYRLVA